MREEFHRCFPLLQRVLRVVLVAVVTCDLRGGQRGGGRGRYNSLKMRLTTRRREHALRAFVVVLFSTSLIHKEMGTPRLTRALFCFASLFLTKFDANPHFVWGLKRRKMDPSSSSRARRRVHSLSEQLIPSSMTSSVR